MEKIKEFFKEHWLEIVLILIIIALVIFGCWSCTKYKNEKTISDNNIVALTDSINYYKGENGKLCAEKTLLIGDNETLELAYKDLSKELKAMKVKNAAMAAKLAMVINNQKRDTVWAITNSDSIHEEFNFDDMPYRKLSGYIDVMDKQIAMSIDTDQVFVDLNVAVEDNKVKVSSNNPYLTFDEIYGITVPEYEPTWCLVVGPSISAGWSPLSLSNTYEQKPFDITIGVSLTFGWNIKGVGKRVKRIKQ